MALRSRRRSRITKVAVIAAASLVVGVSPAMALSTYVVDQSTCNAGGTGAQLQADSHLKNDDRGSTDYILAGTDAKLLLYNCSTRAAKSANLELDWTITAYGYNINCGAGIPASFSCNGTSSQRTYSTHTEKYGSSIVRSIDVTGAISFKDGSFGDTTKVCTRVTGYVNGSLAVSASACVGA